MNKEEPKGSTGEQSMVDSQQSIVDAETINLNQEIKTMEVHHHPHVEKKSFKEYLLEGLMIFIAVSMGFIAENIREHIVDNEREQQYIEAFVRDLKTDTASLNRTIQGSLKREKLMDSLLVVSNSDLRINANAKKLVNFFLNITTRSIHIPSTIAVTQLKSTGSFRLLNPRKGTVDSILRYDKENEIINDYSTIYLNDFNLMWEAFYPICDVKIFRDTSIAIFKSDIRILKDKPIPPLHLAQEKLSLFTGHVTRQISIVSVYRNRLEAQLERAIRLINFLQKEYHLEKE